MHWMLHPSIDCKRAQQCIYILYKESLYCNALKNDTNKVRTILLPVKAIPVEGICRNGFQIADNSIDSNVWSLNPGVYLSNVASVYFCSRKTEFSLDLAFDRR
jgi:hypothetical protein